MTSELDTFRQELRVQELAGWLEDKGYPLSSEVASDAAQAIAHLHTQLDQERAARERAEAKLLEHYRNRKDID
jgi:hypothetical protein